MREKPQKNWRTKRRMRHNYYIPLGTAVGTAAGVLLFVVTGNVALLPLGVAVGLALSVVFYAVKKKKDV